MPIIYTPWAEERAAKNKIKSERGKKLLGWKLPNYPSINIQNVPGSMGIRELIKPEGVFIWGDFDGLEMNGCGQSCKNIVGYSRILEASNKGDTPIDLHSITGAEMMNYVLRPKKKVTYEMFLEQRGKGNKLAGKFRKLAKILNLGIPGLLAPAKMLAEMNSVGFECNYGRVVGLINWWFRQYPEVQATIDFIKKHRRIKGAAEPFCYWYEVNGRVRWGCTLTEACNGLMMQSPAADGMKHACWLVEKACTDKRVGSYLYGCKPLISFHDEIIIDCPLYKDSKLVAEELSKVMIEGMMQKAMPDARLSVEWFVGEVWTKDTQQYKPIYEGKYWIRRS